MKVQLNLPDTKSKSLAIVLFPVILLLSIGYLLYPFVTALFPTDHDALAMLTYVRDSGNWAGWTNGFFFNGFFTVLITQFVNATTDLWNDYYLSYRILSVCCFSGTVLVSYFIILHCTKNRRLALFFSLLLCLMPGEISLLRIAEDNIISAFTNTCYLAAFLFWVVHIQKAKSIIRQYFSLNNFILSFALLCSILSHRQQNILWISPALLFLLVKKEERKTAFINIVAVYSISIPCFLVVYAGLAYQWNGTFSIGEYFTLIKEWGTPNKFYKNFYFWNAIGWNLPLQASNIYQGFSQIFSRFVSHTIILIPLFASIPLAAIYLLGARSFLKHRILPAIGLLLVIHVPNSLVYESENLERWDVLIAPLLILTAILINELSSSAWLRLNRYKPALQMVGAVLLILLLSYNTRNYIQIRQSIAGFSGSQEVEHLVSKLKKNVTTDSDDSIKQRGFVLYEPYQRYVMYVSSYFPFSTSMFVVADSGGYYMSYRVYPKYRPLSEDSFFEKVQNMALIFDRKVPEAIRSHIITGQKSRLH